MKTQFAVLVAIILALSFSTGSSYAEVIVHNLNQSTGTVSYWETQYPASMTETWNINIGENKLVKLDYLLNIGGDDTLSIYSVDNYGNDILLLNSLSNYTGTVTTKTPNGKVKIVFKTTYYPGWTDGTYKGFKIDFSPDNSFTVANDAHITGNAFFDGKVGIGTLTPREALEINGAIRGPLKVKMDSKYIYFDPSGSNLRMNTNCDKYIFDKPILLSVAEISSSSKKTLKLLTDGKSRITVLGNGNVGINTETPQYTLDVKGAIRATEIKVETIDRFPDFVFDKNYRLPDLNEVHQFIQENGHLSGIPSASEVKENGMSLVEMQIKLLQKIEELTLYVIKQENEIKELRNKIK